MTGARDRLRRVIVSQVEARRHHHARPVRMDQVGHALASSLAALLDGRIVTDAALRLDPDHLDALVTVALDDYLLWALEDDRLLDLVERRLRLA